MSRPLVRSTSIRVVAGILALTLAACATTPSSPPTTSPSATSADGCSRLKWAATTYNDVFSPIRMQKQAIEDCGNGNAGACISTPLAIPYTTLLYIVGLPLVFPLFVAIGCPAAARAQASQPDATVEDAE